VQGFCKEFVSWKALQHPNVLSLLGVIMTETEFSMVSEWMPNGNINQFVSAHQDANRFELVCLPFKFLYFATVADGCVALIAERYRKGLDLYARPGYDSRRPQGCTSSKFTIASFS